MEIVFDLLNLFAYHGESIQLKARYCQELKREITFTSLRRYKRLFLWCFLKKEKHDLLENMKSKTWKINLDLVRKKTNCTYWSKSNVPTLFGYLIQIFQLIWKGFISDRQTNIYNLRLNMWILCIFLLANTEVCIFRHKVRCIRIKTIVCFFFFSDGIKEEI